YAFAVSVAPPANEMPVELRDEVRRAQAMSERFAGELAAFLRDRLVGQGLVDGRSAARFNYSLEILLGRKNIYFQQPTTYFFPELPQIQFYDRDKFPWLDKVEAATADIRAELVDVLKEKSAFGPYVQRDP